MFIIQKIKLSSKTSDIIYAKNIIPEFISRIEPQIKEIKSLQLDYTNSSKDQQIALIHSIESSVKNISLLEKTDIEKFLLSEHINNLMRYWKIFRYELYDLTINGNLQISACKNIWKIIDDKIISSFEKIINDKLNKIKDIAYINEITIAKPNIEIELSGLIFLTWYFKFNVLETLPAKISELSKYIADKSKNKNNKDIWSNNLDELFELLNFFEKLYVFFETFLEFKEVRNIRNELKNNIIPSVFNSITRIDKNGKDKYISYKKNLEMNSSNTKNNINNIPLSNLERKFDSDIESNDIDSNKTIENKMSQKTIEERNLMLNYFETETKKLMGDFVKPFINKIDNSMDKNIYNKELLHDSYFELKSVCTKLNTLWTNMSFPYGIKETEIFINNYTDQIKYPLSLFKNYLKVLSSFDDRSFIVLEKLIADKFSEETDSNSDEEEGIYFYCLIKRYSELMCPEHKDNQDISNINPVILPKTTNYKKLLGHMIIVLLSIIILFFIINLSN